MNNTGLNRFIYSIVHSARIEIANQLTYVGTFLSEQHRHPDLYQMSYIVNGRADVVLAGRRYQAGAGHLLWLPPNTRHGSYWPDERERFELAQAKFSVSARPAFRFPVVMAIRTPNEWLNLFRQIINEYHRQRSYRETALGLLLAQLVLLMAGNMTGGGRRQSGISATESIRQAKINNVVRYLHQHYRERVSLKDAAKSAAMSVSALSHDFRRFTGLAPIDYLINYRLSQAVAMMGDPRLKISAVAEAVGFASPYYFCRQFKKRYRFPPRAYYRRIYRAR